SMPRELHIASCVVHARPEALSTVQPSLERIRGVEVTAQSGTGRIVVTLEADSQDALLGQISAMRDLPGVLSAALVFHHAEPLGQAEELPLCP
ncbi:MAG: chaperone NapD, partial [Pseudoxanthomonas mexicana]|nr:chaperone NapD [Pseudoxanthomonas mexicana]